MNQLISEICRFYPKTLDV